jgi:chaperonin GroEL
VDFTALESLVMPLINLDLASESNAKFLGEYPSLFINNREKDQCVFEDCRVLVCDAQIDNIFQIENVLKPVVKNQHKLLIIAPCSGNMLNTLAANVVKNNVRVCVVQPPNFGWKSHELMEDIALSLGATYFSEKTGDDLSLITMDDLGYAKKVIVGKTETVISKRDGDNVGVEERVAELKAQYEETKLKADRDHILNRIASLVGGIGVIYAGGVTDTEQKEKFDRIEDAVCAVRAALEEGILPGGGMALYNFDMLYHLSHWGKTKKPSYENSAAGLILSKALKEPFDTIMRNAGCDGEDLSDMHSDLLNGKWNIYGYDAKTKKKCHMVKKGIIDPAKVTKSALLNAVSVATTIMSTNAIVTLARTYEAQD